MTAAGSYVIHLSPDSVTLTNGAWRVEFPSTGSQEHYTLERSTDFNSWTAIAEANSGASQQIFLQDTNSPATRGFYRVRVTSLLANASVQAAAALGGSQPAFVQLKEGTQTGNSKSIGSGNFNSPAGASNLVVTWIWYKSTSRNVVSVSDTKGNNYSKAVGPTTGVGTMSAWRQELWYAKNIKGGSPFSVTANFNGNINGQKTISAHEYSGIDVSSPLDAASAGTTLTANPSTPSATLTSPNELIFGAALLEGQGGAGSGFTQRSSLDGNVTEDEVVAASGTYAATFSTTTQSAIVQMAAFKPAVSLLDTTPPTVPTNLTATAITSSVIQLSWQASTDDVGVAGYRIYRTGTALGTTGSTSFSDGNLSPSTTYSYSVAAFDSAGNTSAQCPPVAATTLAVPVPVILSFACSPTSITVGQSAVLSWSVSNASNLSIDSGVGNVTGLTSFTVQPTTTTTYTLYASNGSSSTSAQTTLVVNPVSQTADTTPPVVSLVAPVSGSTVSGNSVALSATASDPSVDGQTNSGLAGVQFQLDGQSLGTEITAAPYSLVWDSTTVSDGSHLLTARARDAAGNTATSAASAVVVSNLVARTYTTTFPTTENPLSELGRWINGKTTGLNWSDCAVKNHMAVGAQTDAGATGTSVNDSTAILTGAWGLNQTVSGTVFIDRSGTLNNNYIEIELRLRTSITPHSCTGYEINYSANVMPFRTGYIYIVRWNGPYNDFTDISNGGIVGTQVDLHTGDVISASISNATIRAYINGTNFLTATDSHPFTNGCPGIGFDLYGDFSQVVNYGFKSFTATAQ